MEDGVDGGDGLATLAADAQAGVEGKESVQERRARERAERKAATAAKRAAKKKEKGGPSLSALMREAKEKKEKDAAAQPKEEVTMEELLSTGADLAKTGLESLAKSANVDKDAVLKAQNKVSSGVANVLTVVGSTAFSLLAEQIKHSRANRQGGGAAAAGGEMDGNRGSKSKTPTFEAYFEEHLGQSHLDALQLLSSTTSSQAASTKKKIPIKRKTKVNKLAAGLKTTLTIGDDDDDGDDDDNDLEGQAIFDAAVAALGKIASTSERLSDQRLRAAGAAATAFLAAHGDGADADAGKDGGGDGEESSASAGAESTGGGNTGAAAEAGLTRNAKLHRDAINRMAHIVSAFVELCRKVAEIVILEGASRDDEVASEEIDAAVLERAVALRAATVLLSSYLAHFADTTIEFVEVADDDSDALSSSIMVELDEARKRADRALKLLLPVFHLALMHVV